MTFDPSYSNIVNSLTGTYAGETTTGGLASGSIAEQDWQYNSPYLAFQAVISSGPDGDNRLNIAAKVGTEAVKAGMVFSIAGGVAVLGVPTKVEGEPSKMSYVCVRGVDTRDARVSGSIMGVPAVAGVEVAVTGFDTTKTYTADESLFAQYKSSAFTGSVTNASADVKDFATGNAPIVGIVSPSFGNTVEKVGDPTNVAGAGFMEVPFLHFFPVYDIARGVTAPSA